VIVIAQQLLTGDVGWSPTWSNFSFNDFLNTHCIYSEGDKPALNFEILSIDGL